MVDEEPEWMIVVNTLRGIETTVPLNGTGRCNHLTLGFDIVQKMCADDNTGGRLVDQVPSLVALDKRVVLTNVGSL